MRFNWIVSLDTNDEIKKRCLDMEYLLRQKISKFLIGNWDDLMDDFDHLVFDVDMVTKEIKISNQSPVFLKTVIEKDFYREFNPNFRLDHNTVSDRP